MAPKIRLMANVISQSDAIYLFIYLILRYYLKIYFPS